MKFIFLLIIWILAIIGNYQFGGGWFLLAIVIATFQLTINGTSYQIFPDKVITYLSRGFALFGVGYFVYWCFA